MSREPSSSAVTPVGTLAGGLIDFACRRFASDTAMRVATDAVQLFGAAGISADTPINRYFRDAKVLQIIEGTNQIQRNIIGDSLLGRAVGEVPRGPLATKVPRSRMALPVLA